MEISERTGEADSSSAVGVPVQPKGVRWGRGAAHSSASTPALTLQPQRIISSWSCSICAQLHHAAAGLRLLVPVNGEL